MLMLMLMLMLMYILRKRTIEGGACNYIRLKTQIMFFKAEHRFVRIIGVQIVEILDTINGNKKQHATSILTLNSCDNSKNSHQRISFLSHDTLCFKMKDCIGKMKQSTLV